MSEKVVVKFALRSPTARTPTRGSKGAAGLDLYADLAEPVCIPARGRVCIPTGIAVEIPLGYEGQVRSRSGLALRAGVVVLNSPGTIDSDYRGDVEVLLVNHSGVNYYVRPGDRIAQLIIAPVASVEGVVVEALSETERGGGRFGSTGK